MPYGLETILKIAPHRQGTSFPASARATTYSGVSAADAVVNGGVFETKFPTGAWITWIAETDCYLHFYGTDETPVAASASNSIFLPGGVFVDWWHRPKLESLVNVIQKTAGGNLYRWPSSP